MKILILILLTACGADPDDYQPQESDGCRSDDIECQEALKEETEESSSTEAKEEGMETAEDDPGVLDHGNSNTVVVNNNVVVNTGDTAAEEKETSDVDCASGKLCREMTKAEVIDLFGDPSTISSRTAYSPERWNYARYSDDAPPCPYRYCTIEFNSDGKVQGQSGIHGSLIDVENF